MVLYQTKQLWRFVVLLRRRESQLRRLTVLPRRLTLPQTSDSMA